MKAALYYRISQDRTGERAGIERQRRDCRDLAERLGYEVVAEVDIDNDVSAYRRRRARKGWSEVVDLAKDGAIDAIVCWHPDRAYRSMSELEDLVTLVERHDLVISSVEAGVFDLSTPTGRLVARQMAAVARYESEHKARRQARQHSTLAEQGRPSGGGRRPFGYLEDKVTLDPTEADGLRQAAEHILAGGSLASAAVTFSDVAGRTVRPNILRATLTSPRIAGLRGHIPQADRDRGAVKPALTEATWPAILDRTTWTQLRAVLLDPARAKTRPPRSYLLTGVLVCGLCGTSLAGSNGAYKCSKSNGGCAKLSIAMGSTDQVITKWAREKIDHPATVAALTTLASTPLPDDGTSVADVEQRQHELAGLFADGLINADEWRVARDRLVINADRAHRHDAGRVRAAEAAKRAISVLQSWDSATVDEHRSAISALVERIEVSPSSSGKRSGPRFDDTRLRIVARP